MRIGLDLHVIDGKFQGTRTHVIELFSRVAALCPELEFVALLAGADRLCKEYPGFDLPNVKTEHLPHCNPFRRLGWELPRLQRRLSLDLLHVQYILPMPSFCPTIVTIHDILFESHPEYFTPFFRLRSRTLIRLAALHARHVFTVSDFSQREIRTRYGVKEECITVIPNGVDFSRFYPGHDGGEYLERRGLHSGEYFLSVGRLEPRKNHVALLKAYARLGVQAPKLVLVGQRDFAFEAIFDEIANPAIRDHVLILEDVSDRELPALYRHCLAFLYPSFAEGFGMPPLEAMASGVPVVVANNTALTEVVGQAGVLISSDDIEALSRVMYELVSNNEMRSTLIDAGLRHAQKFSWDIAAQRVAKLYKMSS